METERQNVPLLDPLSAQFQQRDTGSGTRGHLAFLGICLTVFSKSLLK